MEPSVRSKAWSSGSLEASLNLAKSQHVAHAESGGDDIEDELAATWPNTANVNTK